jgi:hypothetical protein
MDLDLSLLKPFTEEERLLHSGQSVYTMDPKIAMRAVRTLLARASYEAYLLDHSPISHMCKGLSSLPALLAVAFGQSTEEHTAEVEAYLATRKHDLGGGPDAEDSVH